MVFQSDRLLCATRRDLILAKFATGRRRLWKVDLLEDNSDDAAKVNALSPVK